MVRYFGPSKGLTTHATTPHYRCPRYFFVRAAEYKFDKFGLEKEKVCQDKVDDMLKRVSSIRLMKYHKVQPPLHCHNAILHHRVVARLHALQTRLKWLGGPPMLLESL
jgi:hypothetical protein